MENTNVSAREINKAKIYLVGANEKKLLTWEVTTT